MSSAPDRPTLVIAGERVDALAHETFEVQDPARRELVALASRGRAGDVDRAVTAAATAFPGWDARKPRERSRALRAIAAAVDVRSEELARLVARETGNPIRTQARPELALAVEILDYFGSVASEAKGLTSPLGPTMLNYTLRRPYGVVGAITPWNVPVVAAVLKIAMALATGNTVVLKPAEDAPLAIAELAALAQEHLPPGVLNVVTGFGGEAGAALLDHPGVGKLSFTGSTAVGRLVAHAAADRILPVSLELGGKSPAIVFPDSDDDAAAAGVVTGMRFTRQGQSCTAGSRLFVHEEIFDSFLERLSAQLGALRVGDPLDEATDVGAIISLRQYERVRGYVEEAVAGGARLALGSVPPAAPEGGLFMDPVIVGPASNDSRIAREEVFGPVLVAIPWRDERELIAQVNDTPYGLAGFVWSRDIGAALRTAHAIDAGWIQINQAVGQQIGQSFGGSKQSGLGREYSLEGAIEGYTQVKAVDVNLTR